MGRMHAPGKGIGKVQLLKDPVNLSEADSI